MKKLRPIFVPALIGLLSAPAFGSCGSAFCTVNSNWTSESAAVEPGSSFDLRYEYIKQDQPRSGTDDVRVGEIHRHHDEVRTINRNVVASFSHTFASGWGVSVVAPIVDREHEHVHNHHGVQIPERWDFTELGDVRLTGRYQLPLIGDPLKPATAGLLVGVKLPTGKTDVSNRDGDVAERSLQPGTGTTDLIVGGYYHQRLPRSNASWFVQAQYQRALAEHDDYKPGAQLGADLGYRYGVTDDLGALIQLNTVVKWRDSGAESEPEDTGSRSVFISPGLSYAAGKSVQLYGFYQLPIYRNVNGVQLVADRAFVLGVSGRF